MGKCRNYTLYSNNLVRWGNVEITHYIQNNLVQWGNIDITHYIQNNLVR